MWLRNLHSSWLWYKLGLASSLSTRLWRHHINLNSANETRSDVLRSHFSIVIYACISCKYENLVHSLATWERHTKTQEWEQKQQLKIHHSLYIWEYIVYVKPVNNNYFQVNHSSADCTDVYIYIYMHIYMHVYTHTYINIYIYISLGTCMYKSLTKQSKLLEVWFAY